MIILELFKKSQKSICHQCFNFENNCIETTKSVCTDKKLLIAFLKECNMFNKKMIAVYEKNKVASDNKPESRVDMMGGGFKE